MMAEQLARVAQVSEVMGEQDALLKNTYDEHQASLKFVVHKKRISSRFVNSRGEASEGCAVNDRLSVLILLTRFMSGTL